jgi:hypothetical protein
MATWNYRLVKVNCPFTEYNLYEVYYDDEGRPVARTERPATLGGDTEQEALDAIRHAFEDAFFNRTLKDEEIGNRGQDSVV